MNPTRHILTALALSLGLSAVATADTVWLDQLDLSKMRQGWGKPQVNRSIRGKPFAIAGKQFERGVGTHAISSLWVELNGAQRFVAIAGIDDSAGGGSVNFRVVADGKKIWESGLMKRGDGPKNIDVSLAGAKTLLLQVADAGDGVTNDHADWAEARFELTGAKPMSIGRPVPKEEAVILTPKPGPAPRINGPKVYGCRPGHPFLYRIPTQGERPMTFSAEQLPASLKLDAETGILTGETPVRGEYCVILRAKNGHGECSRPLKIVSGDTLALTPTMGWNHWYTHYNRITDALMREAAEKMVSSGMADVGYQYVSIDDCWMNAPELSKRMTDPQRVGPLRDPHGNMLPNRYFPDMKGLTEFIHARGLKAGIYSSPGPLTCGGFAGSYEREAEDARQFAAWGFDLLKYDWCSFSRIAKDDKSLAMMKKPYLLMGALIQEQPRDIVLNLCQYGMGDVWEWGAQVGGQSWRTAGDLGYELDRVFEVALKNAEHRDWQKPGAWNDPDYIQIGLIGDAPGQGQPHPCPLTPTEQYSFMSLWCLMASPLFYSGDMGKLDEFTTNVLCNPEVIDINQDTLGQCARIVKLDDETFLMVKDLDDGSKALGLCNAGELPAEVTAKWKDVGVTGKHVVRDLWRQKDIGSFDTEFKAQVPRRGVVLVRVR